MTDPDALFVYERALTIRPVDGSEPPEKVDVDRETLASLLADARALRELAEALPRCAACGETATQRCFMATAAKQNSCDECAPIIAADLPWAPVIRRLGIQEKA